MNNINTAYKSLGKTSFYDGMITCSTVPGKAICKLVWNMNEEQNDRYLKMALSGIPNNFSGKLLEVPVGTGILTMPLYKALNQADITCLDYSNEMMNNARMRAEYENMVHEMVESEVEATHTFAKVMEGLGMPAYHVDTQLEHMLVSGMFSAFFETIIHDVPHEKAAEYVRELRAFHVAG